MTGILFNFSSKKSLKEALVFYLFYVILSLVLGFILDVLFLTLTNANLNIEAEIVKTTGGVVGTTSGVIAFIVTYAILQARKVSNTKLLGLSLLSGAIALLLSAFVGLILPSYLSTRK